MDIYNKILDDWFLLLVSLRQILRKSKTKAKEYMIEEQFLYMYIT